MSVFFSLISTFLKDGGTICLIVENFFVCLFFELVLSRGMGEAFCVFGCFLKFLSIGFSRDFFGSLCQLGTC